MPVTVGQWKQQNRIPPEYWPRIIEMASDKSVPGIDSEWLMQAWPPRKNRAGTEAGRESIALGGETIA